MSEYIGHRGLPGELKHLSSLRKIKKMSRLSGQHSLSSGERNGNSPKSHLLRIGNNKLEIPPLTPPIIGGEKFLP